MNLSDSEKIAGLLQRQGHRPVKADSSAEALAKADLIVLNCCSVRQAAVHRVYDKINKYGKTKKIILAGCLLKKDEDALKEKVSEIWHPDSYFECTPIYKNKATAYVPVMTGCNNFCSYCAVPYTRGREKSRSNDKIISEVKTLIKKKCTNIMLLGQNVNSYRAGKANFPKLLKQINDLPSNFRLSFMTSHPKDMSDELIDTMAKCEKLVKEIHLPVQSGDNTILRKMNRHYTASHYKNLIKKIQQAIPGIKISTDIIVGFPGETKKQFENTVRLCRQVGFVKAYLAMYSPRQGTAAFKLKDDILPAEKKRRWQILEKLINNF